MRTLKPFTRAAAALLILLVLGACSSVGNRIPGLGGSESSDQDDQVVDGSAGQDLMPAGPAPDVKGNNASDFEDAVALIQEGRYEDAEIILLGITSDQPELAGPWINLGQVYVALGQPEEARRSLEAAARANPWNCTAHNELGLLSRQHGDFESAERHYLNCLEKVPGDGAANLNLGILYELYLGRLSEALGYYRHYQTLLTEPDRRVQGWVMDLERRLGV